MDRTVYLQGRSTVGASKTLPAFVLH